MGLLAFGENISLYVNGVYLQTVSDFTFLDEGKIGYFVRAATENPFTVSYDQMRVWVLEDELYPPTVEQPLPEVDLPTPPSNVPTGQANVNVNVRTGPSTLFPILGTAQQGDTGEILGINPDGSWYAVSVPTNERGNRDRLGFGSICHSDQPDRTATAGDHPSAAAVYGQLPTTRIQCPTGGDARAGHNQERSDPGVPGHGSSAEWLLEPK